MAAHQTVLTGIKPTGFPHIGNLVGAIRPALRRADDAGDAYFFIADYHALNQLQDPVAFNQLSYIIAATWLACGLDPERQAFYRQSDIPETFELATILSAFTPKGWMNKAHAYKAKVAANREAGIDDDADVNMGLYTYPVLMAADILICDSDVVPVGRDQVQHVEIARDIALRFNHHVGHEVLVLPEHEIESDAAAILGLDGRKMSKSYDNIIPLFATPAEWKKVVYSIKTDSTARDEPKQARGTAVYELFAALASADDAAELERQLAAGEIGWGDAKKRLHEEIVRSLGPLSDRFDALMQDPAAIDEILADGALRVRSRAQATIERVRAAIGRSGTVRAAPPAS